MHSLTGKALMPGRAAGCIFIYPPRQHPTAAARAESLDARAAEIGRFRDILHETLCQLAAQEEQWSERGGPGAAYAFSGYQAVLEDQTLWTGVAGEIDRGGMDAASALVAATGRLARVLSGVRDAMHQQQRTHLEEASDWLWRRLLGKPGPALAEAPPGAIVVAADLPPAELLLVDPERVAGIAVVTDDSRLLHVQGPAGLPVVCGVHKLLELAQSGQRALLDATGDMAVVRLDPPEEMWQAALNESAAERRRHHIGCTADGEQIAFWALVHSAREAESALASGAAAAVVHSRRALAQLPPGAVRAVPVDGDLRAPVRAAPGQPVAAWLDNLADLAAVAAMLRAPVEGIAACVVDLKTMMVRSRLGHPGLLRLLADAASACRAAAVPLVLHGDTMILRLLPLWLGIGPVAWCGPGADAGALRNLAGRCVAGECRAALPRWLSLGDSEAVCADARRLLAD